MPNPDRVHAEISARLAGDAISLLETALVLYELIACNGPAAAELVTDDENPLSHALWQQNG